MSGLRLRTVTATHGANAGLKDGTVRPSSCVLDFEEIPLVNEGFRRMVRNVEFDVCELALTTYLCARAYGKPFTALPVFLVRGLHHGAVRYDPSSGLAGPKALEGRRVGVSRGYTVTTGVWARGILEQEHGVDLSRVTWVRSGEEHVAEYVPPDNVVSMPAGGDLTEMLLAGELAAVIGGEVDRPGLAPLIPDPEAAAFRALSTRGLYPINHLVVVRDELLAAHPGLATDLFAAFAEAKRRYLEALRAGGIEEPTPADRLHLEVMARTGADPLPYGLEPNRAVIEELIGHALRQQILTRRPRLEELFALGTLELRA